MFTQQYNRAERLSLLGPAEVFWRPRLLRY